MLARMLLAMAAFTGAALAFPAATDAPPVSGNAAAPDAVHGQSLELACPNIEQASGVTVVMFPGRDDTSSGVGGVMVTERTIAPGVVNMRVPNIPDLKDHVVRVRVIYIDANGKHVCDGGRVRLV